MLARIDYQALADERQAERRREAERKREKERMHTADDFASAIARRWQDSVLAIIDVGKLLLGAKAALPHGRFGAMVEGEKVPFGWQAANKLMATAQHAVLTNSAHVRNLPSSWRTLYELTRAPDEAIRGWLTDGTIHPEMERKDVLSLLRSLRSSTRKAVASRPGKYNLILADPPWKYDFMSRSPEASSSRTRWIAPGKLMASIANSERNSTPSEGQWPNCAPQKTSPPQ